ncbi:TIGR02647 family protein [Methyloglobulus morosus KoM1]|uniref:TIGR02647 family protein n=1 Tax=Methyloglobulus morosus KoM1 TaxID=1116472 RepID=V5BJZ3_9GAMM|nr:TIGR02647 family protein [Methyloglobulus morosus]ESS73620.1 TIGR02647 family protein [Methyloglobulus morosus KoM1]
MQFTQENLDELNILVRYKLTTTLEGIKVHTTTAAPSTIEATRRLFDKGLVTLEDGGYLTTIGLEAAEHAHALLGLMNPA